MSLESGDPEILNNTLSDRKWHLTEIEIWKVLINTIVSISWDQTQCYVLGNTFQLFTEHIIDILFMLCPLHQIRNWLPVFSNMTLVNQYPSFFKNMQQVTFAYRATKQQLRYVENIWPPDVAEFYFHPFTFIKHILLHKMRRWGQRITCSVLSITGNKFSIVSCREPVQYCQL